MPKFEKCTTFFLSKKILENHVNFQLLIEFPPLIYIIKITREQNSRNFFPIIIFYALFYHTIKLIDLCMCCK